MNPEIWGPHAWVFLHSITLNYPNSPTNEEKQKHYDFFHSLQYTIPCLECARHYSHNLKKYPLNDKVLQNRNNFVRWLITIHNDVNLATNKPLMTVETVLKQYYDLYRPKTCGDWFIDSIDQILIILMLIIIIIMQKERIQNTFCPSRDNL